MQNFIQKHPEFCSIGLLIILCVFFLFFGLNFYPILDTQEALFATISKNIIENNNYNVLMLNMQPFLDKPPLYFWLITQSIKIMNVFNEISIRLPNTILSTLLIFFTYFMGKKVLSIKFGLSSAIILLTSLFYLLLSHLAILNIAFIFFITSALYLSFLAIIKEEKSKSKKFLWYGFYIFCGLACLAKGILGIILPVMVISSYCLFTQNIKELYKPSHIIPGIILFMAITIPWYYEMYNNFGSDFISNYIFIPDFRHFFKNIFYFTILFIPAFMPWIIIFYGYLYTVIKKLILRFKNNAKFSILTIEQKISLFGILYFSITFLSISIMQKSAYSILLLIPSAAILTAHFLCAKNINEYFKAKIISFSTYMLATFFTVSTISFAFVYMFLPLNLFEQAQQFKNFFIIGLNFLSILMLLKLKNKNVFSTISTYVLSMFFIMVFTVVHGFNMFYLSGENELVKFSQYAKTKDSNLIVYNLPIRPSILINSTEFVYFIDKNNIKDINNIFNQSEKKVCYILIKNRDTTRAMSKLKRNLFLIDKGDKYSIYSNINLPKKSITLTKFYND